MLPVRIARNLSCWHVTCILLFVCLLLTLGLPAARGFTLFSGIDDEGEPDIYADLIANPDSYWRWMLFGLGEKPGKSDKSKSENPDAIKQAVKCDMCKDIDGGPACVRACPTGAALRLSPEEFAGW